jgi:plastocyanin
MKKLKVLNILTLIIMVLFVTTVYASTSGTSLAKAKVDKVSVKTTAKPAKTPMVKKNTTINTVKPKAAQTIQVKIVNFAFSPQKITINKGDTVIWTNMDSMAHTVTSKSFDSGNLPTNSTFKYTFNNSGTFDYVCSYHASMTGEVIVK